MSLGDLQDAAAVYGVSTDDYADDLQVCGGVYIANYDATQADPEDLFVSIQASAISVGRPECKVSISSG